LVGLVVGFIAGGYLACSPASACEFKADLAGALGTWVGGLGTIGALVFAVIAFRSEEESRRRDEHARIRAEAARQVEAAAARDEAARVREERAEIARREIERDKSQARRVLATIQIGANSANRILTVHLDIYNGTDAIPIHKLGGTVEGLGPIEYRETLGPGEHHRQHFNRGSLSGSLDPAWQMPSEADRPTWERDQTQKVMMSFELNGRRWKKQGARPPELVREHEQVE
jgi:hypothetical protein